jgi:hypothetical protein
MNESQQSTRTGHLWAIGYADMDRAGQVKGGTVLKTNVDVERAKLIQSTLAGAPEH